MGHLEPLLTFEKSYATVLPTRRCSQTPSLRAFLDKSQHGLAATGPQSLSSPCRAEGAPATYLETYVLFIPEMLVPFPADGRGNLVKHGACGQQIHSTGLTVRWVQRTAVRARPGEGVELLSLGMVAKGRGCLCLSQVRGRGTEWPYWHWP